MEENQSENPTARSYTMGYSDEFLNLLYRRNAKINAAHLLPHLKSGLRVLDFGCGPGTISVGLAIAVEPGELYGVDMEESQIQMAKAAASAGGHENAKFQTGDVVNLVFEDGYFDVAHCHALLTHVPDTATTLSEVRRVLKPGGIISARELIAASSFTEPRSSDLEDAWKVFTKLLKGNGAHPDIGKELKGVFCEAGFADIRVSASFEPFGTPEDIAFYLGLVKGWFFAPATVGAAKKFGLATQEQFDGWRDALEQWKDEPGAFACIGWGEAIGRKV